MPSSNKTLSLFRYRYMVEMLIISLFLVFTGCDSKLELLDDYKDITIVYSLINPSDSISYIRIEKAYISSGNIYQYAKIADSNQYDNKLDVRLISDNNIILFDTLTIENKEDGIFFAPQMKVYAASTINRINENSPLKLEIFNPVTNKTISSIIELHNAEGIQITKPTGTLSFEVDSEIEFKTKENIRVYQPYLRFHYMEQIPGIPSSKTYKYADWIFPIMRSGTLYGGETMSVAYMGKVFYQNLIEKIPPTTQLERYHGQIEIVINTADENFYAYYESSHLSSSIVMNTYIYTNIENGYGVFAARSSESDFIRLNNQSKTQIRNIDGLNFVGGLPEY